MPISPADYTPYFRLMSLQLQLLIELRLGQDIKTEEIKEMKLRIDEEMRKLHF